MKEMYKGVANSPETTITNDINNLDTIIYVLDETRIPELPNLMVLGNGISAETVKVLSIDGNALTVERGFQGVPKSWNTGTIIARNFTEYDYNSLVENIKELDEEKTTATVTDNKINNHNTNGNSHENIIGLLSSLTTDEKADLVSAINEVKSQSNDIATVELPSHINSLITGIDGVHGLKIETGTWTPEFGGSTTLGTATYTTQVGAYYKIGNLVYINALMTITNLSGGSGFYSVSGLPFNPFSGTYKNFVTASRNIDDNSAVGDVYSGRIWLRVSSGTSAIAYADIATQKSVNISGLYRV